VPGNVEASYVGQSSVRFGRIKIDNCRAALSVYGELVAVVRRSSGSS
jgi:hypothetical protein